MPRLRKSLSTSSQEDAARPPHNAQSAMCWSELQACRSILRQVGEIELLYRQALQNLRLSLSVIVAPEYDHDITVFTEEVLPSVMEASQALHQASMALQPEAGLRYPQYSKLLKEVKVPVFPKAITKWNNPTRVVLGNRADNTQFSRKTPETISKLRESETKVLQLEQVVSVTIRQIEKWLQAVESDLNIHQDNYNMCRMNTERADR